MEIFLGFFFLKRSTVAKSRRRLRWLRRTNYQDLSCVTLTDCCIDAHLTVESCLYSGYCMPYIPPVHIHHCSLTSLARLQLATLPFRSISFLCYNVQGISNAYHVLAFFVMAPLAPPFCRFAWALDTTSIETRPAASSSLSHSAHCSFVSPGWPSCHLITSASTLPVHWPGFRALRICTIS